MELEGKNMVCTVKHGGGEVMLWECIKTSSVGILVVVEITMTQYSYKICRKNAEKLCLTQTYML